MKPTSAIIAVTLNCNARCVMCDIWKQHSTDEMLPVEYLKLPASLTDINITGGEPFLREDLPAVVGAIRQACPRARLVISSNGFLVERMRRLAPHLSEMGSSMAVRISIDGIGETHDRLRGIPHGFSRALAGLQVLREAGISDLGIAMTILEENVAEVGKVYQLAEELGVEFSLTLASDSSIYFGDGKSRLRPQDEDELAEQLRSLIMSEYRRRHPKRWFRAWFEKGLLQYALQGMRSLPCDAGQGFFYLDPYGTVYRCHMLPYRLGSLREEDWEALWRSPEARRARQGIEECQKCWMVCTARTQMTRNLLRIGPEILSNKIRAHLRRYKVKQDSPGRLSTEIQ
ncbi:MAG: radical SAM protein [Candidatus Binatia bacterium]